MNRLAGTVLLLASVAFAGCGDTGGDPNRPKTVRVTGVVTLDGIPVEGAQDAFNPEAADGQGAFGRTDAEGRYELTTFEAGDGAVAGAYIVTITKYESAPPAAEASEDEYVPPEAGQAKPKAPKNDLPSKYSQMHTSDLRAGVSEQGENKFDFALTK